MSDDFESIDYIEEDDAPKKKSRGGGALSSVADYVTGINVKLLLFIFIIFMFVSSDMFTDHLLERFDGATSNRVATGKGMMIQAIFLILFYMVADMLIQLELI